MSESDPKQELSEEEAKLLIKSIEDVEREEAARTDHDSKKENGG